jgi:hypothetical protein
MSNGLTSVGRVIPLALSVCWCFPHTRHVKILRGAFFKLDLEDESLKFQKSKQ